MAVVQVHAYNGPGMAPWHPPGRRKPSRPRDDTMAIEVLGAGAWVRSIRPGWMSVWAHHTQSTMDVVYAWRDPV